MKPKTIQILSIIASSVVSLSAFGQNIWTLEACLEYADSNNIQVKKSEIIIDQKETIVKETELQLIPDITLSANRNYSWGRSVDMQELIVIKNKMNSSLSMAASASIPIIDRFSKIFESKSSRIELEMSRYESAMMKLDIRLQVIKAYLEILLANELNKMAIQDYEYINIQIGRCRSLIESGKQPISAIIELETKLSESKVKMIDTQWQIESSKLELEQILDMTYGTINEIPDYDIFALTDSLYIFDESSVDFSGSGNPSIRYAENKYDKALLNHKKTWAGIIPVIGVSLGYMTYFSSTSTDSPKDQISSNINPTIGISLQIPLFETFQVSTRLKRSRLEASYAALEVQNQRRKYEAELQASIIQASKYYYSIEAMKANVSVAEINLNTIQGRFESGIATVNDLIAAQNARSSAISQLYRNTLQYLFQIKIIEAIQGKL